MRIKKEFFIASAMSVIVSSAFVSLYAFADSTVTDPGDFLSQVLGVIKGFGGMSGFLKITAVITLLVSSMKVTFINNLVWSKLGGVQVYVAPALGLLAGVLGLGAGGQAFTPALIFTYITAGAGAVFFHEILDSIKSIPGLGSVYVALINIIQSATGGPAPQVPPSKS